MRGGIECLEGKKSKILYWKHLKVEHQFTEPAILKILG